MSGYDETLVRIAIALEKRNELLEESNSLQREQLTHTYEHDLKILELLSKEEPYEPGQENTDANEKALENEESV